MSREKGYEKQPLSFYRRMVAASASVSREKNVIHSFTEVDITEPRRLIRAYLERTGEKLSFTAYIVTCFARALKDFPEMNSFISGKKLIRMEDVTVSVLVEREFGGERVPEPVGIQRAQSKSCLEIHREVRDAKQSGKDFGNLSGTSLIRFIPGFLLKMFVKLAEKNIRMGLRYGKMAVTAVGMFSKEPVWFLPHGSGTVLVTVGSIINKVVETDGTFESREHLCLTVSFDHDIIDGGPAARFMNSFLERVKSGRVIHEIDEE